MSLNFREKFSTWSKSVAVFWVVDAAPLIAFQLREYCSSRNISALHCFSLRLSFVLSLFPHIFIYNILVRIFNICVFLQKSVLYLCCYVDFFVCLFVCDMKVTVKILYNFILLFPCLHNLFLVLVKCLSYVYILYFTPPEIWKKKTYTVCVYIHTHTHTTVVHHFLYNK